MVFPLPHISLPMPLHQVHPHQDHIQFLLEMQQDRLPLISLLLFIYLLILFRITCYICNNRFHCYLHLFYIYLNAVYICIILNIPVQISAICQILHNAAVYSIRNLLLICLTVKPSSFIRIRQKTTLNYNCWHICVKKHIIC